MNGRPEIRPSTSPLVPGAGRPPVPVELNQLTEAVIGAAIEVHRILGPGYLESTYEEAMCVELTLRGIGFRRQVEVPLDYKGHPVGTHRLDLLVEGRVVVELKAVDQLAPIHKSQLLVCLKSMNLRLGLLINFNVPRLVKGVERVAN